jgi:hypothetical protein
MIQTYINYLDGDFSADYWADEGISHAVALLGQFTASDWAELESGLHNASPAWMVRCAETLGEAKANESFAVLLGLLRVEDDEVKVAALDTISDLLTQGFKVEGQQVESIRQAVQSVRARAGSVAGMALDSLSKKLAQQ